MKRSFSPPLAVALVVFSFFLIFFIIVLPNGAYAASSMYDLNPRMAHESTTACAGLSGSWSNSTNTCTLSSLFILGSDDWVKVEAGATLSITDKLIIKHDSCIINFGDIINKDVIENHGIIDNYKGGRIDAGPIFNILSVGILNNYNSGTILNTRSIGNFGVLYNNGTIIINPGGKFGNSGSIQNDCGGVIYGAISGNPVMNTCTLTTTTTTMIITATTVTVSIERVAAPAIYAWAVGATVIAIILAMLLTLRRKS